MGAAIRGKPPNLLLLITDQQRAPQHWPSEPGWLRELMPNDHELARTGLSFRNAFCSSCMCSPSRATLLTGTWPSTHGVTLTLTAADLRPDPRNMPYVLAAAAGIVRAGRIPRQRVLVQLARGARGRDPRAGIEPTLPAGMPTIGTRLRAAGYHVAYKGKWHLTKPLGPTWSQADAEAIDRDHGFGGWEPPDAGENARAEHFGGGNAGPLGAGWDEAYIRQAEAFLASERLPEPFCLIVSLVNPHDVLGYPRSYREGGYTAAEFRDLGVRLPPTVDERLDDKPAVHELMRLGMTAYLGPLRSERERLDYVNFYAHLHRVVDEKIGRLVAALGDASDPGSLRSRTVVVRCADHGEMGLSHGGLRQKAFNAYEETIRVPLVISNPLLFSEPRETDALASLIDVAPTVLGLAGADAEGLEGLDLAPVLARHARPPGRPDEPAPVDVASLCDHVQPAETVRPEIHFTYDDHQAATATADAPGQPNRVRAIRDAKRKYAVYLDPIGLAPPEYELYDLERDPNESSNLVDHRTGEVLDRRDEPLRAELAERLEDFTAGPGRLAQLS